jgi:hypothetical protein
MTTQINARLKVKSIVRREIAMVRKQVLPAVLGWARTVE